MKSLLISVIVLLTGIPGFLPAQYWDSDIVDGNNWKWQLTNQGSWAYKRIGQSAGGEFPKGSGNFLIYAGGLYIGAVKDSTASDPEHRYSVSHLQFAGDFTPGPIRNGNVPLEDLAIEKTAVPIYTIDPALSGDDYDLWPAVFGAPLDQNRFPMLVSDLDSWLVFNDVDLTNHDHEDTPVPGLGVEVQQMTYQFLLGDLANTIFIRWRITNKTDELLDSLYFGLWSDPDLGDATNDLVGTDTVRNMMYVYNFDDEATPTGKQYAVGYKFLYDSEKGADVVLHATTVILKGYHPHDDPHHDAHRYHYLRGLEGNGVPRNDSDGTVEYTGSRFDFPGDPVSGQGLTQDYITSDGSDMRFTNSAGLYFLDPGETVDIIFGIIGGEGDSRNDAILNLRARSDALDFAFPNYVLPRLNLDVDRPNIEMSVLQNPESALSDRVRLYVTGDEPVSGGVGTATLNGGANDFFLEWIPGSDNLLTAEVELDDAGPLQLDVTARDVAGNAGTLSRSYTVFRLLKDEPGTFASDDGQFVLAFPEDAIQQDAFGLIGWQEPNDERSVGRAYCVSSGASWSKPVRISFKSDPKTGPLVICEQSDPDWVPLETVHEDGVAMASVQHAGTFALFRGGSNLPGPVSLLGNYPNPFNPSTTIRFNLSEAVSLKLTVYNVLGQKVAILANGPFAAGEHSFGWDGKNAAGLPVSSGIYVYRLEAGKFVQSRKMMLLR